jgi:AcrR family transcriptional regulator
MSTVRRFERERLLDAMLEEMAEKDYPGAEVEAALSRAGLSGNEWLVEFPDKDSCLFAAYEQLTERLVRMTCEGCALGEDWPMRVRCGLAALLEELAARPPLTKVLIRAFPAIGPQARSRYQAFVEGFATLLAGGREFSGMSEELPIEVEMLAVGAAEAIVFDEIEAGRAAQLPGLGPAILFSLLVPFLGPERASAEMEGAGEGDLEVA